MYIDTWHYKKGFQVLTKYNSIESLKYDHEPSPNDWTTVVGNLSIQRGMIVEWKFKIVTTGLLSGYSAEVIVGIADENNVPYFFSPQRNIIENDGFTGIGYHVSSGYLVGTRNNTFGRPWYKGDIIKMTLNLQGKGGIDAGSLSFEVNGVPQGQNGGIAVNDLDLGKTYKMMMSCANGEKIQLVL